MTSVSIRLLLYCAAHLSPVYLMHGTDTLYCTVLSGLSYCIACVFLLWRVVWNPLKPPLGTNTVFNLIWWLLWQLPVWFVPSLLNRLAGSSSEKSKFFTQFEENKEFTPLSTWQIRKTMDYYYYYYYLFICMIKIPHTFAVGFACPLHLAQWLRPWVWRLFIYLSYYVEILNFLFLHLR